MAPWVCRCPCPLGLALSLRQVLAPRISEEIGPLVARDDAVPILRVWLILGYVVGMGCGLCMMLVRMSRQGDR